MLGAIAGDIIGSPYEARPIKTRDFPLFSARSRYTDDSVLTVATAEALLEDSGYAETYKRYYRRWPHAGYGGMFHQWAASATLAPYNSFGNGSAMRVSPIGWARDDLEAVVEEAARSASVSHDHPEGVRGAQATAAAVFLARTGHSRAAIAELVSERFGYALDEPLDALRRRYGFDPTCQGTVPPALIAFLAADGYEDAVRNAVSLGGDSDTLACITGSVAEAFFGGVPAAVREEACARLAPELLAVVRRFTERWGPAAGADDPS